MYFTAWMDSKPVHMLSTFPSTRDNARRLSNVDGRWERIDIPRPTVIKVYNDLMGGTDKFDQFNSYYDQRLRSKKWPLRIILHFLRGAAVNAHILFNHGRETKVPLLNFLKEVVADWCQVQHEDGKEVVEVESPSTEASNGIPEGIHLERASLAQFSRPAMHDFRCKGAHNPIVSTRGGDGADLRGRCRLCKHKTTMKCSKCRVSLCAKRACWGLWHSTENLDTL